MHAADVQDRDGGALVMATLFGMYPFLLKLYADGGYQGPVFRRALKKILACVNIEIVKRISRTGIDAVCYTVLEETLVSAGVVAYYHAQGCRQVQREEARCRWRDSTVVLHRTW